MDQVGSLGIGFTCAFDIRDIETPLPRPLEEYASPEILTETPETLDDLYSAHPTVNSPNHPPPQSLGSCLIKSVSFVSVSGKLRKSTLTLRA